MVKCRVCYKKYASISSLNRHKQEKHGPKKLCPYCFNYFGRLKQHYLTCKKYQRYCFDNLKVINGEIFFIHKHHEINIEFRDESSTKKNAFLKKAKKINKTDFLYFPNFKLEEGSFCKVFYAVNDKTNQEVAIKFFKAKKKYR